MKKLLVSALALCILSAHSRGQEQPAGAKNLQVLFSQLGENPVATGGIGYRKFNAAGDAAWRINLFIGFNNNTEVIGQPIDTGTFVTGGGVPEADKKTSGITFSIRPGYEKHFAAGNKVSPYFGAELLFSMTTANVDSDVVMYNTITGHTTGWRVLTLNKKGDGASTTFGFNLLAGFDYFIAKGLSLGAEFGFGLSATSKPDIESEHAEYGGPSSAQPGAPEIVANPNIIQGGSVKVGTTIVGQLKLGLLF